MSTLLLQHQSCVEVKVEKQWLDFRERGNLVTNWLPWEGADKLLRVTSWPTPTFRARCMVPGNALALQVDTRNTRRLYKEVALIPVLCDPIYALT
jgi:hypothetical protein